MRRVCFLLLVFSLLSISTNVIAGGWSVVATIPVGPGARDFALNPDGTVLYVSCSCGDVYAIDTRTLTTIITKQLPVSGCDRLNGIGVALDGSRLLVCDEHGDTYFLNPTTLEVEAQIPYNWESGAMKLAISPDGIHAYGLNPGYREGHIYPIDIDSAHEIKKVEVEGNAFYMAINPAGTIGYLTIRDNGAGIDNVIRIYSLPDCDQVGSITTKYDVNEIEERDGVLYVASPNARRFTFVDLSSGEERSVPTLDKSHHMDLSPDGKLIAVTNRGPGSVSFLDAGTGEILQTVETCIRPTKVLFSLDSRRLYVTCGIDGTVIVLEKMTIGGKETAKDNLDALKPTGDKKLDKHIDRAIAHIEKSLDEELWLDETHLVCKKGKKVFKEEQKAVKKLMKEMKKKQFPEELVDDFNSVFANLVDVDEMLAQTQLDDARGYPSAKQKEIEKAEKEIAKAEREKEKGKYDKAIDHYKKAWEHAWKAMGGCDKGAKCKGVVSLTLKYNGDATVSVEARGKKKAYFGPQDVEPGDFFTIENGDEKLGANTEIWVNGSLDHKIHTSCSRPLDVGDVFGDFEVVGVEKMGGGQSALERTAPLTFALSQNNPNPFSRETAISYTLPASGHTTVKIYDTSGRLLQTLLDEEVSTGVHTITWDRENAASGIYFCRLSSNGRSLTRKMVVVR